MTQNWRATIDWLRKLRHRPALLTMLVNYGTTASYTLTSIISVPIALHYLTPQEFGLWAFTNQSVGFFMILDFGVSMATARLVAAPLAAGDQTGANQWFSLSLLMVVVQGFLMALVGFLLVNSMLAWFDIPAKLAGQARLLWLWFLVVSVVNYVSRISGGVLYAQNRFYWSRVGDLLGAWVSLVTFTLFLTRGTGVIAYAYGVAIQSVCTTWIPWFAVWRGPDRFRLDFRNLGLSRLRELYGFSGALFLSQVSGLVLGAGQTMIVTKIFGLSGAAGYNVSAKIILTARGLLYQLFGSFFPGWQQSYLKGQAKDLLRHWRLRFDLLMSMALVVCTIYLAMNRWFVSVWARPDLYQGVDFDLAGASFCLATVFALGFDFAQVFAMRVWGRAISQILSAGISLGLAILMVRQIGMAGVFWAGTIGCMLTIVWYNVYQFRFILLRPNPGALDQIRWKCFRLLAAFILAACVIIASQSFSVAIRLVLAGLVVAGILGLFIADWKSSVFGLFVGQIKSQRQSIPRAPC